MNASFGLSDQIIELGFEHGRMKTGTPVRIDGRTINTELMQEQKGDDLPGKFSFSSYTKNLTKQRSCYITYTSPDVHDILKTGFNKSPLFNKTIEGIGPRYCPSIEDKIVRFSERERHQLFIEPEGWNTVEMYVNGFSSSLPEEIQFTALRKIKGLENVKIFKPGYAIEYDYFSPTQLNNTLETKIIENLYFAGQIYGTTGYEEAAAQGLMAGINAHQKITNKAPFVLSRSEAYIGVLIDDLITKGTEEPYRMFTSRSEYRMLLRQDNADLRLSPKGFDLGLLDKSCFNETLKKIEEIAEITQIMDKYSVETNDFNSVNDYIGTSAINQKIRIKTLLLRPEISILTLMKYLPMVNSLLSKFSIESLEESEIQIKYSTYISKEKELAEKVLRLDNIILPSTIDFNSLTGLSNEAREKLFKIKPTTIGQASRISGVSPADISVLLIYIGR